MNDCPNAEMRDLLCDVVHRTLADADCRRVEEHIATCADCKAELALLQRAREVLTRQAPAIDTARIAAAIPRRSPARAFRFSTWRIAASIAVIAVGAASLSVARQMNGGSGAGSGETAAAYSPDAHGLSFSGRLSTLNDEDLAQLLAEIDDFDGSTPEEPATMLPVPAWDGGTR